MCGSLRACRLVSLRSLGRLALVALCALLAVEVAEAGPRRGKGMWKPGQPSVTSKQRKLGKKAKKTRPPRGRSKRTKTTIIAADEPQAPSPRDAESEHRADSPAPRVVATSPRPALRDAHADAHVVGPQSMLDNAMRALTHATRKPEPVPTIEQVRPKPVVVKTDPPPRIATASPASSAIRLDGKLEEDAWKRVEPLSGFTQRSPDELAPASFDTQVRVLYGTDALYVGVLALDPNPSEIRAARLRRDDPQGQEDDHIVVSIDGFLDRRTATEFRTNAAGSQFDRMTYDDIKGLLDWDAVWDVATARAPNGWIAEYRIPYSSLRYSSGRLQKWGFQVTRYVPRTGEYSTWSPQRESQRKLRFVSAFGTLDGLKDLSTGDRVKLDPYVVTTLNHFRGNAGDPLNGVDQPGVTAGLDATLRLSSAATVVATFNPDFGQIEADPSQINLTANELLLVDRRPFFVEGANVFDFNVGELQYGPASSTRLFYSRRLGAPPRATTAAPDVFSDEPDTTTILGAIKLNAKTRSGWSLALLDAVTAKETGRFQSADGMTAGESVIEPLSNYGIALARRDLNGGRTQLGAVATAVNRDISDSRELSVHDQAYAAGLQLNHRFGATGWVASGAVSGSDVHGTAEAIDKTQRGPVHRLQRPDSPHSYDSMATRLSGLAERFSVVKNSGWLRLGVAGAGQSSGYEINDLGFQRASDSHVQSAWIGLADYVPGKYLGSWEAGAVGWTEYGFGELGIGSGDVLSVGTRGEGAGLYSDVRTAGFWNIGTKLSVERRLSPTALRGGPAYAIDGLYSSEVGVSSDNRRQLVTKISSLYTWEPSSQSHLLRTSVGGVYRGQRVQVELTPLYERNAHDRQYVTAVRDMGGTTRYILGRVDQNTASLTARVTLPLTTRLSAQLYAEAFLSRVGFSQFKEVVDARAAAYEDRHRTFTDGELTESGGMIGVDADADGARDFTFRRPDVNVRTLRSNFVVRWEYRPGSFATFVWSQNRSNGDLADSFDVGSDLGALASRAGEHVLLVKLNYAFGL